MRSLWIAAILLVLSAPLSQAQTSEDARGEGRITGTVVNDEGEPFSEARICTVITQPHGSSTNCGAAQTDKNGQFKVDHVPMGQVGVNAEKPEAGYWADHTIPIKQTIKLTPEEPLARVILKIGPKPAELTVTVKDKTTGKRVESHTVRWLTLDASRMMSVSGGGANPVLIPPATDLILEVSAPSYENWFYIDPAKPAQPILRLSSGEQKELTVELQPAEAK